MGRINWFQKLILWLFQIPVPPTVLEPEECQCGHDRCHHTQGIGKCHVDVTEEGDKQSYVCACQVFIKKRNGGDDDPPVTPSPEELEKLYRR